jgi:glycosyltransferase involved in cell wall biosynthesis
MLDKFLERFYYVLFLSIKAIGNFILKVFIAIPFILKRKATKDVYLYPYALKGSDGYYRRFTIYEEQFKAANLKYHIHHVGLDAKVEKFYFIEHSQWKMNRFIIGVYLKRWFSVFEALHYKNAVIQRGMLPFVWNLNSCVLEEFLHIHGVHIIVDYWDSVFQTQPELVSKTIQYAHVVTVSNLFLKDYFDTIHPNVNLWHLGIDFAFYEKKQTTTLGQPINLFWTGLPHNLRNLEPLLPLLKQLSEKYPLVLNIVCKQTIQYPGLQINQQKWDITTFKYLLANADIGLYPELESVHSKGKSAMKVMDYLAAGLPAVIAPWGMPNEIINGTHAMVAQSNTEWLLALEQLIVDQSLRDNLSKNGRQIIDSFYSIQYSFNQLRQHLLVRDN